MKNDDYHEAEHRIKEAKQRGATELWLWELHHLNELPDSIAELASLQSLDLNYTNVSDLSPLSRLTALQSLGLVDSNVNDLSPLRGLTALLSLSLGDTLVSDLSPLSGLTSLQSLHIKGSEVSDLTPLSGLTALQCLFLARSTFSNLSPLSELTALKSLYLIATNVSDLSPLSGLRALQTLMVNETYVSDLSPLSRLTALQSLRLNNTRVSDLSPLRDLTSLQELCFGRTRVSDLTPIAGLTELQKIYMYGTSVHDLSPLAGLTALRRLHLSNCKSLNALAPYRSIIDRLTDLRIRNCQFDDVPRELCEANDDVAKLVKSHFADLDAGSQKDCEIKLCVLGNGGVGKTQLCRLLQGDKYEESIKSTHGIQLGHFHIDCQNDNKLRVNVWDFGGQDIYLGSHSLFVRDQTIYVVLWTPELEMGTYTEDGLEIRNRPLKYWIDYVRSIAGPGVPLIIAQSKCDVPDLREKPPGELPPNARMAEFSAKENSGLGLLREQIRAAAGDLLHSNPLKPIGVGRVAVRNHIRTWQESQPVAPKTITVADFQELCKKQNGRVSSPSALLDFLGLCGVVIFDPKLFDGMIIVDQSWALDAIYAVFHREKVARFLKRHNGRFTRSDLELLVWGTYSCDEQILFLSMMQSCGVCFPLNRWGNEEEIEYLAPELLPGWGEAQDLLLGRLRSEKPMVFATVDYEFLHEGILRGFLSKIGTIAGSSGIYWKYGCWFVDRSTSSQVFIESDHSQQLGAATGRVTIKCWKKDGSRVIETLISLLLEQTYSQTPQIERSWTSIEIEKPESTKIEAAIRPDIATVGPPKVFVSFAWGEDKHLMGNGVQKRLTGWKKD